MSLMKANDSILKPFKCARCAVGRWLLLAMMGGLLAPACRSAPLPADTTLEIVTDLAELGRLAKEDQSRTISLRIEGAVRWSSKAEGRIILSDDTSILQLELNLPCPLPDFGDRHLLEGDCLVSRAGDVIRLSGVPVVDHDGTHGMEEEASGIIDLEAGRHAIRAAWFNRTGGYGLRVEIEGPDLPRQTVPADLLFRLETISSAATNHINGLNYRSYEGRAWKYLPNVDHIVPVVTGVATDFETAVRSRENHVALLFSGFIEIPKTGSYTFYLQSDDGSRLFIGDSSLRIHTLGRGALPLTRSDAEAEPAEEPEFKWTEIEGAVTSVYRTLGSLEIEVMTKQGLIKVNVAEDSGRSYTLMPQNRIRVTGLARRIRTVDRGWVRGELFVQQWDDVEQLYIVPNIWTEYPRIAIGDLVTMGSSNRTGTVVHLKGGIVSQGVGKPLLLEDESGCIVLSDKVPAGRVGQLSDVLGRVALKGSDLVLQSAHFPQGEERGTETNRLPVLTTVERIYQLSHEEAAWGYPVKVRGVITSIKDYVGGFEGAVIQGATGGIYVDLNTQGYPVRLEIGEYCEIEGTTAPFLFQPDLKLTRLKRLGVSALPTPVQPTWDQLINGSLHCNYVELEGVVTSIKDYTITLLTRDGRINVRLFPMGAEIPPSSLGATLRLRGCVYATWDDKTGELLVGDLRLDQQQVTMIHPAPLDPFAIPLKNISDLLQFDPQAGALHRVRVSGVLVYQDEQISCLMDGEHGLRYIPAEAVGTRIGDRVEVVGFVDLSGPSPLLRDAVVRGIETVDLPEPRRLEAHTLMRAEYDATWVQVKGLLLEVSTLPDGTVFDMQSGLRRFTATVRDQDDLDELPTPGSTLELTGVYLVQGGRRLPGRPNDSFNLLLNSGRDIRVISRPPWWTFRRLGSAVGLLIGVLLASLVWINLLHRKVEQRTEQLGDQIRRREIEQERTRVAQDLHDDLGGGLTEVNMLASLIQSPTTTSEEKARYVDELNELALRMVASLDEIVWAINPRNDTITSLADYFGLYAQRLLELASVGCGLDVAENLPNQPLAPRFRQEMFLAFKEALINVVQHANATKVWVRISIQDNEMVVIVTDDGCGIMPGEREAGADGLANMCERMKALGGQCDIQSDQNKGTTVRLQAAIDKALK